MEVGEWRGVNARDTSWPRHFLLFRSCSRMGGEGAGNGDTQGQAVDAGGQQQQQQVAGGRECQEQEKQQEGAGGAWDGAAANGGEAERGEGGHARDCKGKERRRQQQQHL